MKNNNTIIKCLLGGFLLSGAAQAALAQDSIWVKYDDRFKGKKRLMTLDKYDSIEVRSAGNTPVLRRYSNIWTKGYSDYRVADVSASNPGVVMFKNPGLVLYKPNEFSSMDFTKESSKWCFARSKESEHFVVFWEAGFGSNPNASTVPSNLRVDIDDLLKKAERFYATNIDKLQMVKTGQGKSQLDKYKIEIYLLYQTDWLATGSGYDDKIAALWVNPSTCQPVGSTIGHEIGHSFQYQTYCDNIINGKANDHHSGFRYGYPGSNGGCGFWEQCAQWQSFQDYPSEAITSYHFSVWIANHHRHFEHEWQRYASYWLQYYMTEQNGITALGRIWNESKYPEDAIGAYTRIFNEGDYATTRKQLFEYAQKAATFDFDQVRQYVTSDRYDSYSTKFLSAGDGWWQVTYANCPAPTGFNVVPLDIPEAGTKVTASLKGLSVGSALLAGDPGIAYDGDGKAVNTVTAYNQTEVAGKEGWAYGFVALKADGTRVYGDYNVTSTEGTAEFTVPENTSRLFLVVQGSPTDYRQCPWDDNALTDDQLPYQLKVEGADLQGYIYIDPTATPQDVKLEYNVSCKSSLSSYQQGTINLATNGGLNQIAKAFCLQPSEISANTSTIGANIVGSPSEGKVVLGLEDASGNIVYNYSANGGFYVTASGSRGTWGVGSPVFFEYDKNNFTITYGHYPGKTSSNKIYTVRPVLTYMKDGKKYNAHITINMYFDKDLPE